MTKLKRMLALLGATTLVASLGACSGGTAKPGADDTKTSSPAVSANSQTQPADCASTIVPAKPIETKVQPVDGDVPAISAGTNFGEKPTIAEGTGNPPTQLIRKTLIPGNGSELGPLSEVTVHYLGKLWQGNIFDNSYDRGEPSTFSLQGVVGGWTWGLNGAHVGDRVELVIPPELGYPNGSGDKIPAGSTLVFVVDIVKAFTPPAYSASELAELPDVLKQAQPTKEALPAGLEVHCELGQEPQLAFAQDAKMPTEPTQAWVTTGKGRVITENDYVGFLSVGGGWADQIRSSWTDGSGVEFISAKDTIFAGKTVGSRLVAVIPPSAQNDKAFVQVVDIVSAAAPQE